jgi:hypothetical protein
MDTRPQPVSEVERLAIDRDEGAPDLSRNPS